MRLPITHSPLSVTWGSQLRCQFKTHKIQYQGSSSVTKKNNNMQFQGGTPYKDVCYSEIHVASPIRKNFYQPECAQRANGWY